ncbi:MAG: hypothetical protein JWO03_1497 [Bacteroidetes bacterium]|nr:hypothetical protein [Bacteroidota bacterium]
MTKALFCIFTFMTTVISAQTPGLLDNTFDTDGKVSTAISGYADYARAVVVEPNGKIVVAGHSNNGTDVDFALARYNPNGSLDNTFGTGGKVSTDIDTSDDLAFAVALQTDGKIIAAGSTGAQGTPAYFALVRYNTDGTLDNSFGTGGKVTTAFGTDAEIAALAIQTDGKIVVAGYSWITSVQNIALVRYNTNGTLDNTFGTGGKVNVLIGGAGVVAKSIALQADGKIVVAGHTGGEFAVARFNTDGSLDNGFNTGGTVTTTFGSGACGANAIAIQADGKIVVAGYSAIAVNDIDFAIARYNTDGTLDNSFSSDGKVITAFTSNYDEAYAVILQPDGKIIAVGSSDNGTNADFTMARYNADGSLDNAFGSSGKVITRFGLRYDEAFAAAMQPDGKIVLAGVTDNGPTSTDYDFAIARYFSGVNVSIEESAPGDNLLHLYPNPATSQLNIEIDGAQIGAQLNIYDVTGSLLQTGELDIHNSQFYISDLPAGVYIAEMKTKDTSIKHRWVKL